MTCRAGEAREGMLTLADGRRIAWREYGDPAGLATLALHGTPGSRLLFAAADPAARGQGMRLIAPDRWGYGRTDPHRAPGLPAFSDDMARVADHLGLDRFAVLGVSGGGPFAAAVAALQSDRVTAAALVAPVGPIVGEPERALGQFHRFCFGPLARSRWGLAAVFRPFRRLMLGAPRAGLALAMARVPAVDRGILQADGVSQRLQRAFVEGLSPGVEGPLTDMTLFGRPWNLPLERAVDVPARLWLGERDRSIPLAAARRLAGRLPHCDVVAMNEEGHLWVARNYQVILEWIAQARRAQAGARPPK